MCDKMTVSVACEFTSFTTGRIFMLLQLLAAKLYTMYSRTSRPASTLNPSHYSASCSSSECGCRPSTHSNSSGGPMSVWSAWTKMTIAKQPQGRKPQMPLALYSPAPCSVSFKLSESKLLLCSVCMHLQFLLPVTNIHRS